MSDTINPRSVLSFYDLPNGGKRYHWYLTESIDYRIQLADALNAIRNSDVKDEIHVHLNGFGGAVGVGTQIIAAFEEAEGTVYTYNEGCCASMFALIFLSGHYCKPAKHSWLMLHQAQTALGYNANSENIRQLLAIQKRVEKQFRDIIANFLTEEELDKIFNHAFDLELDYDEQVRRLNQNHILSKDIIVDSAPPVVMEIIPATQWKQLQKGTEVTAMMHMISCVNEKLVKAAYYGSKRDIIMYFSNVSQFIYEWLEEYLEALGYEFDSEYDDVNKNYALMLSPNTPTQITLPV